MVKKAHLGQLGDVDIRRLRVFRAVTEAGGFSAAELELNIGRSTISTHIKDLEVRLGVTLCQRGRSGFVLTEEGRHIYQSTLRLLGSLDAFSAEVEDIHQHLTGQLNLAFFDKIATNSESRLSKAFSRFSTLAPEVNTSIYVDSLNDIEQGVIDGKYQVGIIPDHRVSSSLKYQYLFDEQMYLYCGRDHVFFDEADNVDEQMITSAPYAGLGYHSPNMEISRQLNLTRKVTVYDQEAIIYLLQSGKYIGFLPDHYAESFERKGLIKRLKAPSFSYRCQFYSIYRVSPKPSRLVQTFLDCLHDAHAT